MHGDIPPDEAAEFAWAFNLYVKLDEARATAERLRAAAAATTGSEWRENVEGAGIVEAEIARIEAELGGEPRQGEAAAKPCRPRGRKPSDAPVLLVHILDALESYAAATGQDFDRKRMPGPLGESFDDEGSFHWLCAYLYPRTFKRAKETFEKHRAGICALGNYAKQTDFYRLALSHIAPKLGVTLNVHRMPKKGRKIA